MERLADFPFPAFIANVMAALPEYLPSRRLFEQDCGALSELELLALLLGPGMNERRAFQAAHKLLERLGSVRALRDATYGELRQAGLGRRRALAVLAAVELAPRMVQESFNNGRRFHSSAEIFQHFRFRLEHLKKECFWDLLMDGKNRIIKVVKISEGTLTSSLVHPREVFRPALREAAAGVLFVHNHPSGDPGPSQEDIQITRRLVETGRIIGIRVLDHVIIGAGRYFSFADEGLL